MAIRSNWERKPSSQICQKHFISDFVAFTECITNNTPWSSPFYTPATEKEKSYFKYTAFLIHEHRLPSSEL